MNINFKIFQNSPELKYGISEKSDGSMKINPETKQTLANRAAFFSRLGADKVFSAGLYHEKEVHIGTKRDAGKIVYGVDGLVTNNPGLYLTLTVADCFPVYFFDPKNQIVGIAHAGWRGILAGVIKNTVTQMKLPF
jgi:copper oxidase (laccase) domain-containing protein